MRETERSTLPLTGGCNCRTVRFEVRAPFETAGYCHCTRCQRRTGCGSSPGGIVSGEHVVITAGVDEIRTWQPQDGFPKSFCGRCGGHLYSGTPGERGNVGVRLGALDDDPGIPMQYRQWVSSAVSWEPIPGDGLPRYEGRRPVAE